MSQRLQIERVPALQDNYLWLVREPKSGFVAIVDPADPVPVRAALKKNEWTLTHILNTHHHNDHNGGLAAYVAGAGSRPVIPPLSKI